MNLKNVLALRTIFTRQYNLPPDESTALDWLIYKHISFNGEFFYPISKIVDELYINKDRLRTILFQFIEMGFLTIRAQGMTDAKAKVTVFTLNPSALKRCAVRLIADQHSDFFKEWVTMMTEIEQKTPGYMEAEPFTIPDIPAEEEEETPVTDVKTWHETSLELFHKLIIVYNTRVKKHNNNARKKGLPERIESEFEPTEKRLENLTALMVTHSDEVIVNAFISFTDQLLRGNINCDSPFDYFLTFDNKKFEFPVFTRYLDKFNAQYKRYNNTKVV